MTCRSCPICVVLLAVVLLPVRGLAQDAPPAPSRPMPSWLRVSAQARARVENEHLLERLRAGTTVAPSSWLRGTVEVQDARAFGIDRVDGGVRDVLDVRHAFVDVGTRDHWITARVGRQSLAFGSERVIGAAEWGNTARVFEAARVGLHHGAIRADVFTGAVVANMPVSPDHRRTGTLLSGVYGSVGALLPGATIEPYVLERRERDVTGESGQRGRGRETTLGVRLAGRRGTTWSYEGEVLGQWGRWGGSAVQTLAWTGVLQRHFPDATWSPSLLAESNYASGDDDPTDGVIKTLDQLFGTNHGIYGVADRVGRRNTQNARVGLTTHPRAALTVKAEVHGFWLASRYDGLYAAGGGLAIRPVRGGAASTHVGTEFDLVSSYRLSPHADLGLQVGHLVPGGFVRRYETGHRHPFYCVYLDVRL